MDYGIFNVRTNLNACDCTLGCTDTVRESTLKVDTGRKKSLAAPGNRTMRRRRAGAMLFQLSYIPTHHASGMVMDSWKTPRTASSGREVTYNGIQEQNPYKGPGVMIYWGPSASVSVYNLFPPPWFISPGRGNEVTAQSYVNQMLLPHIQPNLQHHHLPSSSSSSSSSSSIP